MVATGVREPVSKTLQAMLDGFVGAAAKGGDAEACVAAAIDGAGRVPLLASEDVRDGVAKTPFAPMLERAVGESRGPSRSTGVPADPINANQYSAFVAFEKASGVSPQSARTNALELLAGKDGALREVAAIKHASAPAEELISSIESLARLVKPEVASEAAKAGIEAKRPAAADGGMSP